MRLRIAFALALATVPVPISAQRAEGVSAATRSGIERATSATIDSLFDAFRSLDTDEVYRLYAKGTAVLHISDAGINAMDTLSAVTRDGFAALRSFEASWEPHSMLVPTPDIRGLGYSANVRPDRRKWGSDHEWGLDDCTKAFRGRLANRTGPPHVPAVLTQVRCLASSLKCNSS